jgi:hypothetical protein
VHNFSLAPMPAGTQVRVRFYGVPWNQGNNTTAGPSFLLGEATQEPIPPFNTDTDALDWVLVGTTFDTAAFDDTKNGDVYLSFWVVAWVEDGNGQLVGEMPGRGPTALSGTLASLADAAALEEPHSNNVGFYKLAFYVFPHWAAPPAPSRSRQNGGTASRRSASETWRCRRTWSAVASVSRWPRRCTPATSP